MTSPQLYKQLHNYFPFGFHLSRKSWENLDIAGLIKTLDAYEATTENYGIRLLTNRFNERYARLSYMVDYIRAGELISTAVIVDILRYLFNVYCFEEMAGVISRGLEWTARQRGRAVVERSPRSFVGLFPPWSVIRGDQTEDAYSSGRSEISMNYETVAGEMILLSLAMENRSFRPFRELFDDVNLKKRSPYQSCVEGLEQYFEKQPVLKQIGMTLFSCLRAPMMASPDSLQGQLDYIRQHWADFLPPELLERLLLALDILKEEQRLRGLGPGPNLVLQFGRDLYGDLGYPEPAMFSQDADWMSNVVILAKSVYVWLDQLSKRYRRHIKYLSDIPDEELDRLARWGFTGLWLIGLWERSLASQKIKQIMGNPEASASAYSIYDYTIAEDLGGEDAYRNLHDRARRRGIRLASDMVPNHMGIYSKWIIEHPDWFIRLDYPPFPCYQYTGQDLSWDQRVTIQIEDGYWSHGDAAVVFKRIDKWTGDVKYIYHGNDGTSMPWNDTAQLDFTMPEVREAVIQMILHVARKFPIIRFDAAMTLAKRHYQRLWFPRQGDGGAVPSRAERGMSGADFNSAFPGEFWREVVDRVAAEVPDTLLIAEAFWLMEGYFVRTLGMHRVYNSAFMNMLKMEDNADYRTTVKNVLEFSPEVIKRFVNFMNNPDERTAVEQFGKGDKYFGVAALMVTMPGLPMFGHGQIEGLTEKYGMEYHRAYWDEPVDEEMVRRHEVEIFPLMRRRRLFSGAENFAFYDFNTPEGWVDENVFAYSNRAGDERAVILYNNAYNTTHGRIHTSTQINVGGSDSVMIRRTLAEALALNTTDDYLYSFRDHKTGLEYIRAGRRIAEEGLYADLYAYQYHAFLDFREIHDTDGSWSELSRRLNGRGVHSIEEALREMKLDPILVPFRELLNADLFHRFAENDKKASSLFVQAAPDFFNAVKDFAGSGEDYEEILQNITEEISAVPLEEKIEKFPLSNGVASRVLAQFDLPEKEPGRHVAVAWVAVHRLGELRSPDDVAPQNKLSYIRLEEWLLRKTIAELFAGFLGDEEQARVDALLVAMLTKFEYLLIVRPASGIANFVEIVLEDPLAGEYLQFNRFNGVFWINKERLDRLVNSLLMISLMQLSAVGRISDKSVSGVLKAARKILNAADKAEYQVEKMAELLSHA
jgi:glycosidase